MAFAISSVSDALPASVSPPPPPSTSESLSFFTLGVVAAPACGSFCRACSHRRVSVINSQAKRPANNAEPRAMSTITTVDSCPALEDAAAAVAGGGVLLLTAAAVVDVLFALPSATTPPTEVSPADE
eukprot:3939737-Rhodomonas_salina.2